MGKKMYACLEIHLCVYVCVCVCVCVCVFYWSCLIASCWPRFIFFFLNTLLHFISMQRTSSRRPKESSQTLSLAARFALSCLCRLRSPSCRTDSTLAHRPRRGGCWRTRRMETSLQRLQRPVCDLITARKRKKKLISSGLCVNRCSSFFCSCSDSCCSPS